MEDVEGKKREMTKKMLIDYKKNGKGNCGTVLGTEEHGKIFHEYLPVGRNTNNYEWLLRKIL